MTPGANVFDAVQDPRLLQHVGNVYKNGLMEYRLRNLDTTNLQSIEVLKGPAAMLFGRGEPGGIINLVVKRPLETPYYSVAAAGEILRRDANDGRRHRAADAGQIACSIGSTANSTSTDSYRDFVTDRNFFIAPTLTLSSDRAIPDEYRFRISEQHLGRRLSDAAGDRRQPAPIFRSAAIFRRRPSDDDCPIEYRQEAHRL